MSKNADDIRSEIEQTRGAMGTTLEALGDRVAPKKVAARAKADVADKVDDVRHRLSPVGVLHRTTSRLRHSLEGAKSTTTALATDAATEAEGLVGKVESSSRSLTQQAAGNPLAMGALAFGAGIVVAGFLPPTERERQVAGRVKERVEPLKDQAIETGRTIMGELKPVAETGIEQVKDRTVGAVEHVKGEAKGSAKKLKEEAKTASGQVKQTTKEASGRVRSEAKRSAVEVKGEARQSAKAAKQAANGSASSRSRSSGTTGGTRPRAAKAARASSTTPRATGSRSPRRAVSPPKTTSRAR